MHWGCGATFTEKTNPKRGCCYHPGKFEFGSEKGWWPEGWSCCRGPWEALGCTKGKHSGIPAEDQVFLCINHGEVAPGKIYPDSFCGEAFTTKHSTQCAIHAGYVSKGKTWSCCGGIVEISDLVASVDDSAPCVKGEHKYVAYPLEEAKLYFFSTPINVYSRNTKLRIEPRSEPERDPGHGAAVQEIRPLLRLFQEVEGICGEEQDQAAEAADQGGAGRHQRRRALLSSLGV